MSELRDLLPVNAIRLDVDASDWRAAIRAAGELLGETGVAGDSYTDAMIRVVEEHGPYIVLTPGFALAHSRPDDSVTRTGMSLVRLAEPVRFGHDTNDPVTLVMALASVDSSAHQDALAALAGVLAAPERREALERAQTPDEVRDALTARPAAAPAAAASSAPADAPPAATTTRSTDEQHDLRPAMADTAVTGDAVPSKRLILTVCGNGLGTSLFLKNTTEQVLDRWGWTPYLSVEATDTISAKGRAKEADFLLTSGAIAQTLGDVGVPVEVIDNFTSQSEIDATLRRLYAI
ncbi:PTS sugar transporter subunit IIA [Arsenicicoccus bolidensis]|uniref:PTS sugar transporter subunit IIA n=1 Tax=Arsenicicoccus bolidensis TaxID=229480 RepID=UPI0028ADD336|nr:PTS sugar transporter subunit IIA [Arsenicicoccus bolidensis]